MSRRRSLTIQSIRGVVYLLLVIAIFPAMLAHIVQNYRAFQAAQDEAIEDNAEFAQSVATAMQTYINELRHTQQAFGDTLIALPPAPRGKLNVLLAHMAGENPTWRGVCWLNPAGEVLAASRPEMIGCSLRDRTYFRTVATGAAPWAISNLYRDPITGAPTFAVAQSVLDEKNSLRGVCLVLVDPQRLDAVFTFRQPPGAAFVLIDRGGMLVYREPKLTVEWKRRQMLARWPTLKRALQGKDVTGTMSGMDGVRRIFAGTPITSLGWAVVAGDPEQAVMAPARQQFLRDIIFFVLLCITAFFVGLIVSRFLTRPLGLLREYTHHVAHGELDRRVVIGGPAELAELAVALNGMTAELQEHTSALDLERKHANALAAHETRYAATLRVLIETVPAGIIECDREGNIILLNPMAVEMLGEEAIGGNVFGPMPGFAFYRADGTPFPLPEMPLPRALSEGTVTRDLEYRMDRPGGRETILLTSSGPMCDDAGNVIGAVAVFQDITPLHQLQEERELFIHTISHDLRLPLSIIQGHAQVMEEELVETPNGQTLKSGVKAILRSTSRMNVMIQDLVDSARLAGHMLELHTEPVELRPYLDNLLQRAATGLEVAHVRLEVSDDLPPVCADYARLERIMMNLLSNALKYSSLEAPVTISARREGDEVVISVTDRGSGIAPEDLPNIFARFYRARGARHTEGIGLGLYITRLLVEAHAVPSADGKGTVGGRIWVESRPGVGSTFSFTLPLA